MRIAVVLVGWVGLSFCLAAIALKLTVRFFIHGLVEQLRKEPLSDFQWILITSVIMLAFFSMFSWAISKTPIVKRLLSKDS